MDDESVLDDDGFFFTPNTFIEWLKIKLGTSEMKN